MSAEFLSDEWHAMVVQVGADSPKVVTPDTRFRFKIEKGPNGTQNFVWVLGGGTLLTSEMAPRGYKPDIAVTMKYPILVDVVNGELSFSVGYMRGDVKLEGDPGAVVRLVPELDRDEWAELLSEIWAQTSLPT
ncbi:MAG: SCP2 sterol-binding domain-containing protein [Acidimicrobiales bacterium]